MPPFLSEELEQLIFTNVIEKMFPVLNISHKILLFDYLIGLINTIALCFDFDGPNSHDYQVKLMQNSYKDAKWLLLQLLPFINENNDKMSHIKDLNELYTKKRTDVDINKFAPKYVYSNLQYGRHKQIDGKCYEIPFDSEHLKHNYYLLLYTIKQCRYKLHINWVDVMPIRIDNFDTLPIFKTTVEKFVNSTITDWDPVTDYPVESIHDENVVAMLSGKVKGLGIDDIYNCISVDMYDNIVEHKWLLFDVGVFVGGKLCFVSLISCVADLFGINMIDGITQNMQWVFVDKRTQKMFAQSLDNLKYAFEQNISVNYESSQGEVILSREAIYIIVWAIVIFFNNKYTKVREATQDKFLPYKQLGRISDEIEIDEDTIQVSKLSYVDILNALKTIHPKYMYDFLRESIEVFKNTIYSAYLMDIDKIRIASCHDEIAQGIMMSDGTCVTYKNIYNFCKSMTHYEANRQYVRYPKMWSEIGDVQKQELLDRLNNKVGTKWFNIKGNLIYLHNTFSVPYHLGQIMQKNENIYGGIRSLLCILIFRVLIERGILSHVVPSNDLTDSKNYDITDADQKSNLVHELKNRVFAKDNPYVENAYYYLTNKRFGLTGTYNIKLNDGDTAKTQPCGYFDIVSEPKYAWYLNTAYHWVAQIGFCHRFVNNRITYITGGTGAGKSTQIPKLYCYYLKALDHKDDVTVVVTVPRTDPVTGTSDFVSKEMAVPYNQYDEILKKDVPTGNFYIQMRHMREKSTYVRNGNFLKIRFVTDGSVIQDGKNPLFKRRTIIDGNCVYSRKNICDVLIVDEAHEHNTYMDIILSTMRNCAYYNNQLRFVIMSATMDEDEPIYRRFYRMISDNRKYPLCDWIKKYKLDRINVDRRFDIQPPGQTARFKIDEYFRPEMSPEEMVREIIHQSKVGDVLVFRPGQNEIIKTVAKLNEKGYLPDNVIAIPYYAKMRENEGYKNNAVIAQKIDKNIGKVKIAKSERFETSDLSKGKHQYKRAVLVATNIAEASITINSLKYVVDTGIEKSVVFDCRKKGEIRVSSMITEASRRQRRGRVGRTGEGSAYFLYQKGATENNVKQYNISIQDIKLSVIYEFMREHADDPVLTDIIEDIVTGYKLNNFSVNDVRKNIWVSYLTREFKTVHRDAIDKIVDIIVRFKEHKFQLRKMHNRINRILLSDIIAEHVANYIQRFGDSIESIVDIMTQQYFCHNSSYDYYGNDTMFDYNNSHNFTMFKIYPTGYEVADLMDENGIFYIIHPDELLLVRNIAGIVTDVLPDKTDKMRKDVILNIDNNGKQHMLSTKMHVFFDMLKNQLFLVSDAGGQFMKTNIGKFIHDVMTRLDILGDDMLARIIGTGLALIKPETNQSDAVLLNDMLSVVAMLKFTGNDISNLGHHSNLISLFAKHKSSDIDIIINITRFIDRMIEQSGESSNFLESSYMKSKTFENIDIAGIKNGIHQEGDASVDGINNRNSVVNGMMNKYIADINTILRKFARTFVDIGLTAQELIKYIHMREKLRTVYNDILIEIDKSLYVSWTSMQTVRKNAMRLRNYIDSTHIDIISASLMLSLPYNVCRKVVGTEYKYMSILSPCSENLLLPEKTTVSRDNMEEYILYLVGDLSTHKFKICVGLHCDCLGLILNSVKMDVMIKNSLQPCASEIIYTTQRIMRDLAPALDRHVMADIVYDFVPQHTKKLIFS